MSKAVRRKILAITFGALRKPAGGRIFSSAFLVPILCHFIILRDGMRNAK